MTVRGSRFLAQAVPVREKVECDEIVRGMRKEYFDATHHCFAYRLGHDGTQFRTNDDGEPSGTAGKPILAAIDGAKLNGVMGRIRSDVDATEAAAVIVAVPFASGMERALSAQFSAPGDFPARTGRRPNWRSARGRP